MSATALRSFPNGPPSTRPPALSPANNYERNQGDETQSTYRPRLIALRDALLLFMPDENVSPTTVHVEVSVHGEPLMTLPMAHPNDLPKSDAPASQDIQYSSRAWSVRLPWDSVKNGLSLRFVADQNSEASQAGELPAAAIDIAEASQIVFQSLRLGMLTTPDHTNGHYTLRDPIMAATDYFQTMPVSRLVMGSYADAVLDRVIIRSGMIYDKDVGTGASESDGGIYKGDMRENVGKAQVSVGINMANFGYTSHHMNQGHPHVFKQITNHHAWGMYANGRHKHGLSGGNGIGTIVDSWGNEASHEWGHAYGLGHYPGKGLTTDGRWAVHHADSGWGYIAHRNRMRANLFGLNNEGEYNYKRDAMSGGSAGGPFSVYTLYTGYSARIIQNDVARLPIPDTRYPSGYKKWNTTTGEYENYDAGQPVPKSVGVPVATILGGYDPNGSAALIYPVFHGNYGNVFELPAPDLSAEGNVCWVEVENANGEQKQVRVAAQRHAANSINQINFNLHADFRPTQASLFCRRDGTVTKLTETAFDGTIPELPPVAIVGQEAGYEQLRHREMTQIEDALMAMDTSQFNLLTGSLATLVASYSTEELRAGLSSAALERLNTLKELEAVANELAVVVAKAQKENLTPAEQKQQLMNALLSNDLISSVSDLVLEGAPIEGSGRFFNTQLENGQYVALTPVADVEAGNRSQWTMDRQNRLHPTATPWQCLTPVGGRLGLKLCEQDNAAQRWLYDADSQRLQNESSRRCLDYDRVNGTVITYGCNGGWNQKWSQAPIASSRLLALLNGELLADVYNTLLTD